MNNKVVLKVKGLTKIFKEGKDSLEVLKGIDLEVEEGVSVAIVGTSGSGKSTLLQCLGALDIFIADLSEKQRTQMRNRKLGFVYQFHHLLPEFTSLENTAMPLKIRRVPAAEAQKRAEHLLAAMGLEERVDHLPSQLSGGERQRVAIARAVCGSPVCLLADEPTGNLDRETAVSVFDYLVRLTRDEKLTLIIVTHDPELAARCDRIYRLKAGRLIAEK